MPVAAIVWATAAIFSYPVRADSPCSISVFVHTDGAVEFDGARISDNAKLTALLAQYHKQNPKCEIRISAGRNISFRTVGRVISAMQKAGILTVGFLTEAPD